MEQIHDRVAGLDVHRDSVSACARVPGARRDVVTHKAAVRDDDRRTGRSWPTGWRPRRSRWSGWRRPASIGSRVYYALEDRFEVWLCNAHHVKNVPGRKTDMSDAEWLADVVAHGMVRPSFVPPPPIRELRDLTRYRKRQIDTRAAEVQRLEKVLQDAGIKLTSVASKVLTMSGRNMIEALIAGERDPAVLAEMAIGRMRNKTPGARPRRSPVTSGRTTPSPPARSSTTSTSSTPASPRCPNRSPPGWPRSPRRSSCSSRFPGSAASRPR